MKHYFLLVLVMCLLDGVHATALKNFVIDHRAHARTKTYNAYQTKQSELSRFFYPSTVGFIGNSEVTTDPLALQQVAREALSYVEHAQTNVPATVSPPAFNQHILSTERVKKTLRFIIDVIEEDKHLGTYRILEPDFITKHFGVIKWHGDEASAKKYGKKHVKGGKILLTHYMAFCCEGSYVKTKECPHALYQMLGKNKVFPFSKQEVLAGVLTQPSYKNKVKPLVWVSRSDLETILMQGTGFVRMPDGKLRLFNVHLHNNIGYDKTIKNPRNQHRYWYFKESKQEVVASSWKRYEQRKNIVLAGDIYNIGIGKLMLLLYQNHKNRKPEIRIGVIADTGAAFHNNLYQLDSFAGVVAGTKQLHARINHIPDAVNAYILYKK